MRGAPRSPEPRWPPGAEPLPVELALGRAQTGSMWTGEPLAAPVLGAKLEPEDGPAVREAFQRPWGLSWTQRGRPLPGVTG